MKEIKINLEKVCTSKYLKNIRGIYEIKTPDGIYIGCSEDIFRRLCDHRRSLFRGDSHSNKLQKAFDKHGLVNFEITFIQLIKNRQDLESVEEHLTDIIKQSGIAINLQSGRRLTKEQKQHISNTHKGKIIPTNTIEALRARTGINSAVFKWSEEAIREAASKCSGRSDFHKKYVGAYERAVKMNLLEKIFSNKISLANENSPRFRHDLDYETCRALAMTCRNRSEFRKKYYMACIRSYKNKWINDFYPI